MRPSRSGSGTREAGLVAQRRTFLVDHGPLIGEPVNAAVAGDIDHLARGIGAGQQAIKTEVSRQLELGFGHPPAVPGVFNERHARIPGREHHGHGLGGQTVDGLAA